MFEFEGVRYTLAQMLEGNAHDDDFCAWAKAAQVGDNYLDCVRVE